MNIIVPHLEGDADFSYVDVATAGGLLKLWLVGGM